MLMTSLLGKGETSIMNKEEILQKAQKENNGSDYADLEAQKKGAYAAYFVGVLGILLVCFITYWVTNSFNYGPIAIIFMMAAVAFGVKAITLKKKHEVYVTCMYSCMTIIFIVLWILQLCKVI